MAQLTYREAVAAGIAQEMERDESVVFLGEDIADAGGVFKATVGLLERFGPRRVRNTPISEQAIIGAAMGAAKGVVRVKAAATYAASGGGSRDTAASGARFASSSSGVSVIVSMKRSVSRSRSSIGADS